MFDSGFGGLTVARALIDLLPDEDLVYLGDTGRYPYGPRELSEVAGFAHQITEELVERRGVKLVVVACNTAAAAALDSLRDRFDVPIVGVIEPGVRALGQATRTGHVGVIGTVGTIASGAYQDMFEVNEHLEVFTAACPRFVEFVEAGITDTPEVLEVAEGYLAPLKEAGVDTLVLGCTHYPFLRGALSYVMGEKVSLVSSDDETANVVYRQLVRRDLIAPADARPSMVYEATGGSADEFRRLANRLMGAEVRDVQLVQTGVIDLPYLDRNPKDSL